jgi:hypothetical protein
MNERFLGAIRALNFGQKYTARSNNMIANTVLIILFLSTFFSFAHAAWVQLGMRAYERTVLGRDTRTELWTEIHGTKQ